MSTTAAPAIGAATSDVIPFIRYDDARAAVDWLVAALGFEAKAVFASPDGQVGHAELRFGDAFIMVGPSKEDALGMTSPRRLGGRSSQGICLVVDDPDAHHDRAVAAGATVVAPPADTSYGSRGYTCRDPEGNLWTVGTYRPAGAAALTPHLHYADARAAITWLGRAFGLEETLLVPGDGDSVVHAELRAGNGLVMAGSVPDAAFGLTAARELGAVNQGIYLVVADADAHQRRAVEAGAEVVLDLKDTDYGSREYTCRDLEGNLWSFGTYRP
jgi:uncharacterized glyoxalase superfamily protein PhnB